MAARFDGGGSIWTDGSANALETIGLHGDSLAGAADKNAKCARFVIVQNCLCDGFCVNVIVILGVVLFGAKIREGDRFTFEPFRDAVLEFEAAVVGAEVDMHF